jgi:uncharacterized DUF497 family protein
MKIRKGIYEWDDSKNQKNIEKHGISFEEAIEIIQDPETRRFTTKRRDVIFEDFQHSYSIGTDRLKEIILDSIKKNNKDPEEKLSFDNSISIKDAIYLFMTKQDPCIDRWIGIYKGKYWAVFSVLRQPTIRIFSCRRARDNEIPK